MSPLTHPHVVKVPVGVDTNTGCVLESMSGLAPQTILEQLPAPYQHTMNYEGTRIVLLGA